MAASEPLRLFAALLLPCWACSALADGGDSLSPAWRCLDELSTPAEPVVTEPARVEVAFLDLFQRRPLVGVSVRACLAIDSSCASPVTPSLLSDDTGSVALDLYRGFDGYLEVQGEGLLSSLVFLPLVQGSQNLGSTGLVPEANLRTFNTNFNAGIELERGHIVVRVRDCDGTLAADVALETDVASRRFYMLGGLPEFTTERTSPLGVGGFLNIESAGARVVGSLLLDDGSVFAIGSRTFAVRQGWATFGDVGAGQWGLP
jgi:hypothetical protein